MWTPAWHLLRQIDAGRKMTIAATRSVGAPYQFPVYIACTIFALIVNYLLGKDMASDTLSYHLYAGFNAVHDRFAQDDFPAGPQSYFNPYVYIPFYYLVSSGLSSLEISSILAVVHSIISCGLPISSPSPFARRATTGNAEVRSLRNRIRARQSDPAAADRIGLRRYHDWRLALAGWLPLALAIRTTSTARVIGAGLLCGIATGLKLTNAVYAVCGFVLLIILPVNLRGHSVMTLLTAFRSDSGFLSSPRPGRIVSKRFGNPVFPMMNDIFRSPELTTEPARALRFVPATVAEALWRPFAMIDPVTMVHEELRAPDARYAVLLILAGALFVRWLWRRRGASGSEPVIGGETASARTLTPLAAPSRWLGWPG